MDARVGTLQAGLDSLDGVDGADRERARLHSAMAAAYLVDDRLDEAVTHGERGRAESQRIGDEEAALNAASTLGSVLAFAGRMDEGWQLLEEAIARACDTSQEAEAARGYRMIGSSASELMEYHRAEHWLTEGVRYAENVELWNHRHYMASHLAHVQWATGQWDAAAQTAQSALADGRGGITTRITAQYVLGYLAMGRGDWSAADKLLQEALAGERMAELQRLSPPLWGLAEAARCRGAYDTALIRCERGYQASAEVMDAACLFPTCSPACVRTWRATTLRPPRSGRDGSARCSRRALSPARYPRSATAGRSSCSPGAKFPRTRRWSRRGSHGGLGAGSGKGTWTLLDLATAAAKARRRGEAALLLEETRTIAAAAGATTLVDHAERLTRSFDPGRPADPWHPLSKREYEVAQLVAAAVATNRQIAQQLVLAPKTISAHITHILTNVPGARRVVHNHPA